MSLHTVELSADAGQLSRLVDEAAQHGEVVVTKDGTAVARIVAINQSPAVRRFGSARGLVTVPDDFDAPLADFEEST